MPGIFGIMCLSKSSHLNAQSIFDKMSERLAHYHAYSTEVYAQPKEGLWIGRIGLPHHHEAPFMKDETAPLEGHHHGLWAAGNLHMGRADRLNDQLEKLEQDPSKVLNQWKGFFAMFSWNRSRHTGLLIADRRASVPLYYARVGNLVLFAPELQALLVCAELSREMDTSAIGFMLTNGHLMGDQTLLKAVRRVRGGQALRISATGIEPVVWWRYRPGMDLDGSTPEELEQELGERLERAVRRNVPDLSHSAIFLSGGVDSRAILGAVLAVEGSGAEQIEAISWGEHQESPGSDVQIAEQLARTVQVRHRFMPRSLDEYSRKVKDAARLISYSSDVVAFHPAEHSLMQRLREQGIKYGLRGDEVFGFHDEVFHLRTALRRVYLSSLDEAPNAWQYVTDAALPELMGAQRATMKGVMAEVEGMTPNQAKDYLYFTHRLQCYLHSASYYKQVELEQRNILLDDELLEILPRVSDPLRSDKKLFRQMVARRYPRLLRVPYATRSNLEDFTQKLAQPGPLRGYVEQELNDEGSPVWSIVQRPTLQRFVRGLAPAMTASRPSVLSQVKKVLPESMRAELGSLWGSRQEMPLEPTSFLLRTLTLKQAIEGLELTA